MFLAVDIGNTSINNGLFEGNKLKKRFRVPTYTKNLQREYDKHLPEFHGAIIVSVVPGVLKKVKKILGKNVLVVGGNIDTGIKNKYKNPKQVGHDRLVNARAAYELYGKGTIVVDFGTAITIDIVNSKKEYLGGVIAPGVEISLDALSQKAHLLPKIKLSRPKAILGRETQESMIIGAVYGFSNLCDGLVLGLKKRYCRDAKVIATGGLSRLIGPYCKTVAEIDPDLTLKGLNLICSEYFQIKS